MTDDGLPKPRGFESAARRAAAAAISGDESDSAEPVLSAEQKLRARMLRKPSRVTVGKTNGLFLSWNIYRGAAGVSFDPPQSKPWHPHLG